LVSAKGMFRKAHDPQASAPCLAALAPSGVRHPRRCGAPMSRHTDWDRSIPSTGRNTAQSIGTSWGMASGQRGSQPVFAGYLCGIALITWTKVAHGWPRSPHRPVLSASRSLRFSGGKKAVKTMWTRAKREFWQLQKIRITGRARRGSYVSRGFTTTQQETRR
jgi:hypothetical protein